MGALLSDRSRLCQIIRLCGKRALHHAKSLIITPVWKQNFLQYPESMEGLFCCTRQENHKYFSGDCPCAGFPVKENREWYPAAHRFLQMLSGLESVFRFQSKKYDCWKHLLFLPVLPNSFLILFCVFSCVCPWHLDLYA